MEQRLRIKAGTRVKLKDHNPDDHHGYDHNSPEAEKTLTGDLETMALLQEKLYAEGQHSLLIVLQTVDAGGKDGTVKHVMSGLNPQACKVASFKCPTAEERSHDFLWRIHRQAPPKGCITVFNRSHYEDVLVARVHKLVPAEEWKQRYKEINDFERMLARNGTLVLKFFLHISKDEQKERLQDRLDDPAKHWKFDPNDLHEREHWDDYQQAYHDAIANCSTKWAPWYVVPADRKWFRNWVISDTITRSMQKLDLDFPPAAEGLEKLKVR